MSRIKLLSFSILVITAFLLVVIYKNEETKAKTVATLTKYDNLLLVFVTGNWYNNYNNIFVNVDIPNRVVILNNLINNTTVKYKIIDFDTDGILGVVKLKLLNSGNQDVSLQINKVTEVDNTVTLTSINNDFNQSCVREYCTRAYYKGN